MPPVSGVRAETPSPAALGEVPKKAGKTRVRLPASPPHMQEDKNFEDDGVASGDYPLWLRILGWFVGVACFWSPPVELEKFEDIKPAAPGGGNNHLPWCMTLSAVEGLGCDCGGSDGKRVQAEEGTEEAKERKA